MISQMLHYEIFTYRKELLEELEFFENYAEFIRAVAEVPKDLKIHARVLHHPRQGWDESVFGQFPPEGCLILYTRLPPSQRSIHGGS